MAWLAAAIGGDENKDMGLEDEQDNVYVPMDADIGIYQSTYDLDTRLVDREFEKRTQTDYVTLADVEGEMDELATDKDMDDTIYADVRKQLDMLIKATVMGEKPT